MIKKYLTSRFWIATTTFLICMCITGALYFSVSRSLPAKLTEQLQTTGNIAARNLELALADDMLFIGYMQKYIADHDSDSLSWIDEAAHINEINKCIKSLHFINSEGKLTNLIADKNNLNKQFPKSSLSLTGSSKDAVALEWFITDKNKNILYVSRPVYKGANQLGVLHAGLGIDNDLRELGQYLNKYSFQLSTNEEVKYAYNTTKVSSVPDNLVYTAGVRPYNAVKSWTMHLFYKDAFILNNYGYMMNWMLAFGTIISLLLALFLYFYLKSQEAKEIAEISNMQLVQTNAALELQRQEAQEGSRAKTKFLSNMSHEIRTPLNAILGLCELLKRSEDKDREEYINYLQDSSKILLGLVDDVLAIDRIESGKENLARDLFEPDAILENLIQFHKIKIENKKLELRSNLDQCGGHTVIGDRAKFEQVTFNILSNAIKFTDKGAISISCNEEVINGSHLALKIVFQDTGIGIPKSKHRKIFDRFTQLDAGLRKKHSGGGLGLSISKQFVALMGGSIEVLSAPKEGSTFIISLEFPLAPTHIRSKQNEEDQAQFNLDVLAVDDNKLNVVILTKILQNLGMRPDACYDGTEALQKVKTTDYDIIFMDVHMPKLDGYEATKSIRKMGKDCLIIGLSADATHAAIDEGLRAGMNHYLTKPMDKNKLLKILNKHFAASENRLIS